MNDAACRSGGRPNHPGRYPPRRSCMVPGLTLGTRSATPAHHWRAPRADHAAPAARARIRVLAFNGGTYGHPAANVLRKQTKSLTFSTGGVVLPSQLA